MFQLASSLKKFGSLISIVYDNSLSRSKFSEWHALYIGENSGSIEIKDLNDIDDGIFITSETAIQEINMVPRSVPIWVYQLSIDNCILFGVRPRGIDAKIRHLKNVFLRLPESVEFRWNKISPRIQLFLTQSHYANDFLTSYSNKTPYYYIGDYTEVEETAKEPPRKNFSGRKLRIAYNPVKGRVLGNTARFFNSHVIEFVGIAGLSPEQLSELLGSVDAYVDFGGQPGKDRLPREALRLGVPVFLFRRGAAINGSDFPLSSVFKIEFVSVVNLRRIFEKGILQFEGLEKSLSLSRISLEKDLFDLRVKALLASWRHP